VKPNVHTGDRSATKDEADGFLARLKTLLEKTQERLTKLRSGDYEVRVITIRSHDVVAHMRKTFEKVYLAKKHAKRHKHGVNPVARAIAKAKTRPQPRAS
jgi:hypothetical protein